MTSVRLLHRSVYSLPAEAKKKFGKNTEHFKFVFNSKKDFTAITYTESDTSFEKSDITGRLSEITYHNDGTIMFKFPGGNNQNNNLYKNPFGEGIRKLPLKEIRDWTPIISYKIANYSLSLLSG